MVRRIWRGREEEVKVWRAVRRGGRSGGIEEVWGGGWDMVGVGGVMRVALG